MKLNINVLIGVVLCVVLLGVFGILNRTTDSRDGWRPNDVYSGVGGSSYSTGSCSGGSGVSDGLSVPAVSLRGGNSMLRHRAFSSYAPAIVAPMFSSGSAVSYGGSSGLYTSSSAMMKSFGGGNAAGGSMSGGSVRGVGARSSASSSVVSLPNVSSSIAYNSSLGVSSASADIAALAFSYQGIGNTTIGGPRGISGRKNTPGVGGNLDDWIQSLIGKYGWSYSYGGIDYFDQNILYELYCTAIENGDLPSGVTWEQFLSWFQTKYDQYRFPISGGVWFLCMLAVGYAVYVYSRKKQLKNA